MTKNECTWIPVDPDNLPTEEVFGKSDGKITGRGVDFYSIGTLRKEEEEYSKTLVSQCCSNTNYFYGNITHYMKIPGYELD
jgi:hypothetical protein